MAWTWFLPAYCPRLRPARPGRHVVQISNLISHSSQIHSRYRMADRAASSPKPAPDLWRRRDDASQRPVPCKLEARAIKDCRDRIWHSSWDDCCRYEAGIGLRQEIPCSRGVPEVLRQEVFKTPDRHRPQQYRRADSGAGLGLVAGAKAETVLSADHRSALRLQLGVAVQESGDKRGGR